MQVRRGKNNLTVSSNVQAVARHFQEDGFAIVKEFLSAEETNALEREVDRYIQDVLPQVPRIHKVYESGWQGPLKHFSRLELYDGYFHRFIRRPATLELARACLGVEVEAITSEVFYKPARVGSSALFHQDNAYFNYDPPEGLVVWIALDNTTLENGAVHYALRSHLLGDLPHDETGIILFGKALAEGPNPERHPAVPALLRRGDASVHHFLTAHRSGPNSTDRHRRGFVINYKGENAKINQEIQARHEAYKNRVYEDYGAFEKETS